MKDQKIQVNISNLARRIDRRESIIGQFSNKSEYLTNIVLAKEHKIGALGLWKTFVEIVEKEKQRNSDYFIFCEDDHLFTENYNYAILEDNIIKANNLGADILSGGMSWIDLPVQCDDSLFWVNKFNGMQFTVIFSRFYDIILSLKDNEGYVLDNKISEISDNIFVVYPFISVQKEFGYSDVTIQNNTLNYVVNLFKLSEHKLGILNNVRSAYKL